MTASEKIYIEEWFLFCIVDLFSHICNVRSREIMLFVRPIRGHGRRYRVNGCLHYIVHRVDIALLRATQVAIAVSAVARAHLNGAPTFGNAALSITIIFRFFLSRLK